ncbi:MAG: 3-hydroxyacyl-CoA dehydrogenase NAD-binding domain-containing protein [Thermoplasmataceae archaeon]
MRVSVIGAGTMGSGIAQVFAMAGHEVTLIDIFPDAIKKGRVNIEKSLSKLSEKGSIKLSPNQILDMIKFSSSYDDLKGSELVVEAAFERLDVKKDILAKVSSNVSKGTIIGSNTSSISISLLSSFVKEPENFIGMHFFNPPPIMKLVEIVNGNRTSEVTRNKIFEISKQLGKEPVIVNDYPGFVSNRVLMPMLREAIVCLEEGIGSAEDIDKTIKLGLNHPMGPLTLCDFIGNDVVFDIMEVLFREFGDPHYKPPVLLRNMVYAGKLGRKSGEGFYKY